MDVSPEIKSDFCSSIALIIHNKYPLEGWSVDSIEELLPQQYERYFKKKVSLSMFKYSGGVKDAECWEDVLLSFPDYFVLSIKENDGDVMRFIKCPKRKSEADMIKLASMANQQALEHSEDPLIRSIMQNLKPYNPSGRPESFAVQSRLKDVFVQLGWTMKVDSASRTIIGVDKKSQCSSNSGSRNETQPEITSSLRQGIQQAQDVQQKLREEKVKTKSLEDENNELKDRLNSLNDELKVGENEYSKLLSEMETFLTDLSANEALLATAKKEIEENKSIVAEVAKIKLENQRLKQNIEQSSTASKDHQQLKAQVEQQNIKINSLNNCLADKDKELTSAKSTNEQLQSDIKKIKEESEVEKKKSNEEYDKNIVQPQLSTMKRDIEKKDIKINDLENQVGKLLKQKSEWSNNTIKELRVQLDKQSITINSLKSCITDKDKEIASAKSTIDRVKNDSKKIKERSEAEKDKTNNEYYKNVVQPQLSAMSIEVKSKEAEITELNNQNKSYSQQISNLNKQLEKAKSTNGTISKLKEENSKLRQSNVQLEADYAKLSGINSDLDVQNTELIEEKKSLELQLHKERKEYQSLEQGSKALLANKKLLMEENDILKAKQGQPNTTTKKLSETEEKNKILELEQQIQELREKNQEADNNYKILKERRLEQINRVPVLNAKLIKMTKERDELKELMKNKNVGSKKTDNVEDSGALEKKVKKLEEENLEQSKHIAQFAHDNASLEERLEKETNSNISLSDEIKASKKTYQKVLAHKDKELVSMQNKLLQSAPESPQDELWKKAREERQKLQNDLDQMKIKSTQEIEKWKGIVANSEEKYSVAMQGRSEANTELRRVTIEKSGEIKILTERHLKAEERATYVEQYCRFVRDKIVEYLSPMVLKQFNQELQVYELSCQKPNNADSMPTSTTTTSSPVPFMKHEPSSPSPSPIISQQDNFSPTLSNAAAHRVEIPSSQQVDNLQDNSINSQTLLSPSIETPPVKIDEPNEEISRLFTRRRSSKTRARHSSSSSRSSSSPDRGRQEKKAKKRHGSWKDFHGNDPYAFQSSEKRVKRSSDGRSDNLEEPTEPTKCIYVKNIPGYDKDGSIVKKIFSKFGAVRHVDAIHPPHEQHGLPYAFVYMESLEKSKMAVETIQKCKGGERFIAARFAQPGLYITCFYQTGGRITAISYGILKLDELYPLFSLYGEVLSIEANYRDVTEGRIIVKYNTHEEATDARLALYNSIVKDTRHEDREFQFTTHHRVRGNSKVWNRTEAQFRDYVETPLLHTQENYFIIISKA